MRENKGLEGGIKEIFRIGLAAICRDKAWSKSSADFVHDGAGLKRKRKVRILIVDRCAIGRGCV